ncbi:MULTISPECIES: hypothetical protein [Rickettsieae]|uniref:hypothetical protein n=1 Tax=Rickettsieae TaxID=33988 RepID=UPI0012FF9C70|nr:hypothetical protein [Rickettsia endosymbiont of Culicoides newsteadi]
MGSRNDGATPISNRQALSDKVTNFPSIDYKSCVAYLCSPLVVEYSKCKALPSNTLL